jgi:hypothetical protein
MHLFNDLNTTAGHGLPAEEVPLREEVIPIHDITITLKGYAVKRIHLEPDGQELKVEKAGTAVTFSVPKLAVHAIAVVELG